MDEIEILNGTDAQNDGRGKSNRNFQRIKAAIDYALDPEVGHDHDGFDSVRINHNSLENSGATAHIQIDSALGDFEDHADDGDIHSTAEDKESWIDMIDEIETARDSSSKGAFLSLDARLESMEEASAPTTHDDATGRNEEATGSGTNQSRHLAKSLWDATGSRTVQTALNSLYLGGGTVEEVEDSQIDAGQTSIDGGAPQTFSIRDRMSALYSSMAPINEILNGTFNYLGFTSGTDDLLGNTDGTLLEHGYNLNTTFIPGWWTYSVGSTFETKCHIFCPSGYPTPPFPGYSPTQKEFNYWDGIGFFEILNALQDLQETGGDPGTEIYSYPMPLISNETYTLTWWYCRNNLNGDSTGKMTIQCQNPSTGTIEDLTTFLFPLTDNLWHHKTVTFNAQTYNTNKRGLHRIHIHFAPGNNNIAGVLISKLGLFRGDFSSNVHAIPDASYSSRMMEERVEYPYCSDEINVSPTVNQTFMNGQLFKKTVYLESTVASTSSGEIELQVPPCYYVYNISACPNYFEVMNMNINRAIVAPPITSDDFIVSYLAGSLPDDTYYYVVSLVNDYGESAGSRTFPVTVSGGDNQAGIIVDLTFDKGNATKIRIYRGSSSGNLGLLAEIDANTTGFLDAGTLTPTGERPKKYAEALLAPNDLWFSWEGAYSDDSTPITAVNVKVLPPKTGSGTVIFKVELWPAAMDWPTFGA